MLWQEVYLVLRSTFFHQTARGFAGQWDLRLGSLQAGPMSASPSAAPQVSRWGLQTFLQVVLPAQLSSVSDKTLAFEEFAWREESALLVVQVCP